MARSIKDSFALIDPILEDTKNALTEKSVEVSEPLKVSEVPSYIRQIESGGGFDVEDETYLVSYYQGASYSTDFSDWFLKSKSGKKYYSVDSTALDTNDNGDGPISDCRIFFKIPVSEYESESSHYYTLYSNEGGNGITFYINELGNMYETFFNSFKINGFESDFTTEPTLEAGDRVSIEPLIGTSEKVFSFKRDENSNIYNIEQPKLTQGTTYEFTAQTDEDFLHLRTLPVVNINHFRLEEQLPSYDDVLGDIKSALTAKSVSVPEMLELSQVAGYIGQIGSGGIDATYFEDSYIVSTYESCYGYEIQDESDLAEHTLEGKDGKTYTAFGATYDYTDNQSDNYQCYYYFYYAIPKKDIGTTGVYLNGEYSPIFLNPKGEVVNTFFYSFKVDEVETDFTRASIKKGNKISIAVKEEDRGEYIRFLKKVENTNLYEIEKPSFDPESYSAKTFEFTCTSDNDILVFYSNPSIFVNYSYPEQGEFSATKILEDVKTSLESKGVATSDLDFSNINTHIDEIKANQKQPFNLLEYFKWNSSSTSIAETYTEGPLHFSRGEYYKGFDCEFKTKKDCYIYEVPTNITGLSTGSISAGTVKTFHLRPEQKYACLSICESGENYTGMPTPPDLISFYIYYNG